SVTIKNADIANLMNQVAKLMDDEKVKADLKVIAESQGSDAVTDFDSTYTEMKSSLTDAAKELKENKTYLINNKLTVKSGKENS
ncbi:hypothetical protein Q0M04_14730, partial [Staphylococcus aureus]|nr:hypothetical protein [Staphylococcus aureus]